MTDIFVSIAEFKAKLSQYLSRGKETGHRIIVTKRRQPIASVIPYGETNGKITPMEGLASIAGRWSSLEDISPFIDEAIETRKDEGYREIPF
ncbi:MAG: type II toxin-antitoxin system Phd/YefM family antitoxin [Spirochaetia bacterium]|nr:type II toxin-antitoxin system Phd/YefM family antitoxin [Spirochaetia bacterium]